VAASVYSRTLQKASELIGGHLKLCRYLKVPSAELANWINDRSTPPIAIFLRAVDLVIGEASREGGSEPGDPPPSRDCAPASSSSTLY
jgi:hypothetical protein